MDTLLTRSLMTLIALFSIAAYAEEAPAEKTEATPFAMTTNAFLDEGALPVLYTCDGKDISPQLTFSNIPGKAESLALVLSDVDAPNGTLYHWVVYNIPKSVDTFPEGIKSAPSGATFGINSFSKPAYNGPCPPKGKAHTYFFKLYALDTKLSLPKNADANTVLKALEKHIVSKTQLSAVYSRWIK